jgi:hypothetical protein
VADSPVKAANPTFEPANATVRMADLTFEVSPPPVKEFNPTVEPADAAATELNSPFAAADLTVQVSYPQIQPAKLKVEPVKSKLCRAEAIFLFCERPASCSILNYESDTSIDNHDF